MLNVAKHTEKQTWLRADRMVRSREAIGMNQTDFAAAINDTQQHVSEWERGKYDPGAQSLIAISKVLGVTVDYLLGVSDEPQGKIEVTEQSTLQDFFDRGLTTDEETEFLEYLARRRKGKH